MNKFIIKITLLLVLVNPLNAHAAWLIDTSCELIGGFEEVADFLGFGIEDIDIGFQDATDEEIDVLLDYIEDNKVDFCKNPADGAYKLLSIKIALDRDQNREDALAKFPEYITPDIENDNEDGNNIVDAFRHSRATAVVSGIMGSKWGLRLMNAHEAGEDPVPGDGLRESHYMDLHNNFVGFKVYEYLLSSLGRSPNVEEIEQELLSRCYRFADLSLGYSSFEAEIDSTAGLVYFQKMGKSVESNGVNCAIPNTNNALNLISYKSYFPNDEKFSLSSISSKSPINAYITKHRFHFSRDVMFCRDESFIWGEDCFKAKIFEISEDDGIYNFSFISGTKIAPSPNDLAYPAIMTFPGSIYLLDDKPLKITLEVSNQFEEYSNAITVWINNWAPMIPITNLLLN